MLKARRREIGRDAKTVFEALSISRNHLSAIENARALPTDRILEQLTEVLECEPHDAAHLALLLDIARQSGWWDDYSRRVPDALLELCGLEHGAERVKIYDPMVVTGLLQTEDYARALITANPENSRRGIDRSIELRMRRQARLHAPDPLQVEVLLGETALHQEIGGRAVLRDQLVHVAETLERDDSPVDLRIQPFAATPAGFGIVSTVVLFEFETPYLDTMAWTESPVQMDVTANSDVVEIIELNFELAFGSSLDRDASLNLIHQRIRALDQLDL